jgi:hypothetical protein
VGASQSDLAHLQAEDVNWQDRIICFVRMKTRWRGQQPPQIRFGKDVEDILASLPKTGALFPNLQTVRAGDRATEFKSRCRQLGTVGVTLHSYRYAWAERAKTVGYSTASCSSEPPPRKSESCLRQDLRVFSVTEDALIREIRVKEALGHNSMAVHRAYANEP